MTVTTKVTTQTEDRIMTEVLEYLDSHYTHGAVGTDSTTPTEADTDLGSETIRKEWITHSYVTATGELNQQLWISSTEANGNTLKEFGAFSASSGGDLENRSTFDDIVKTNDAEYFFDNNIEVTITINE